MKKPLQGQVALVTGATRGAGRGIAVELGAAGAIVYCTGRSVRGKTTGRPETLEETAERVTAFGGTGIAVPTDHLIPEQVEALIERIRAEQNGQLDILVNDIWGGDELTEWETPFWELSLEKGIPLLERAIHTHIITSRYAVPLMVARNRGLVIEVTDGDTLDYRDNLFYDLAKVSVIRLAVAMTAEFAKYRQNLTALAVTPGYMRSEAVLDHWGVTEANWRDGIARDPHFAKSETPRYVGRAIAALAADPNVAARAGRVWSSGALAQEYGLTDVDGRTIPPFTLELS